MTGTLNHDPTTPAASYDAYTRASAPSGETTVAVAASPAQAPTPRHTLPVAIAAPATRTTATFFDPWNSSSTGHQRAENRLSTSSSWRVSRSLKLREQFKAGRGGGKRVADTVGAGRDDAAPNARKPDGQKSLAEVWRASKTAKRPPSQENDVGTVAELTPCASGHNQTYAQGTPVSLSLYHRHISTTPDTHPPRRIPRLLQRQGWRRWGGPAGEAAAIRRPMLLPKRLHSSSGL